MRRRRGVGGVARVGVKHAHEERLRQRRRAVRLADRGRKDHQTLQDDVADVAAAATLGLEVYTNPKIVS